MRGRRLDAQVSDFFDSSAEPRAVKRTDHYWLRLPATGLCFLVFGLVTFVLGIVVLPLLRLMSLERARGRRLARAVVGGGLRFFVGFMRTVGVLRYEFIGRERLGRPGQLIVANHPTLIDVVFLVGFAPQANCIVKAGHFRNVITRGAVIAAGYIPNAPTEDMIYAAEAALGEGETLLIFPEGTRSVPGKPMAMQRGAANVAVRAARVLTPVFIGCDPPTLSKNLPWYRIPWRRPKFTLRVGEDIDLATYRGSPVPIASRRLNADLAGLFGGATPVRD
ncbi:MAG TPA: lysophospholipid acyltransferase family protein [Steroidobacteraceae bacterium]|nr:lysophospholipid acyltransferase family protein [Steroidobacteraceae bacterium]